MDDRQTVTQDDGSRHDAGAVAAAPRHRRRPALGLLFLGAILLGGWALVSAHQRAQVVVWYDALPIDCGGEPAPIESLGDLEPSFLAILEASPGLDCGLRIQVENRGRLPATIAAVTLPWHGPATGASIRATSLAPYGVLPLATTLGEPSLAASDAVFPLDVPLAVGEQVALRLGLEFSPDGCMSPGALQWVEDAPTIDVSVVGLTGTRAPVGAVFAQRGTDASSCDSG